MARPRLKAYKPRMRHSTTTIVLVDDHVFIRDLMVRMLARLTHRYRVVGAVGTAAEALVAAKQFEPTLLVLVVYLPDKRVPEVLPEIKQVAPETRVLLCSAYPVDDPVADFARSGADGFVEKTNTWNDFLAAVERVSRGERYFWSRAQ